MLETIFPMKHMRNRTAKKIATATNNTHSLTVRQRPDTRGRYTRRRKISKCDLEFVSIGETKDGNSSNQRAKPKPNPNQSKQFNATSKWKHTHTHTRYGFIDINDIAFISNIN